MDLEALGNDLAFESLRVTILAYTCVGTSSVVLDNLVLEGTFCGNGVQDGAESCDDGNSADGDCCSSTCKVEPVGTVCGSAADICDIEEVCDGTSPTCRALHILRPASGTWFVGEPQQDAAPPPA
jgi:cysteine-rich repeat protein